MARKTCRQELESSEQLPNPFRTHFDPTFKDVPMRKRKPITAYYFGGNTDNDNPVKLAEWITKATNEAMVAGYTNLRIDAFLEEGDENNLERHYLEITGEYLETDAEVKARIEYVRKKWLREHDEFLKKARFYRSPTGKAQILEAYSVTETEADDFFTSDEKKPLEEPF